MAPLSNYTRARNYTERVSIDGGRGAQVGDRTQYYGPHHIIHNHFYAAAHQVWADASPLDTGHPFYTNAFVLKKRSEGRTKPDTGEFNSTPDRQFEHQMEEEVDHLRLQSKKFVDPSDLCATAKENVKDRWKKWGIWNKNWIDVPGSRWKHEELLETCEEIHTAEGVSRPYYQFHFQLEYVRQTMLSGGWNLASPHINTIAASSVRCSWIKQRIWNKEWQEIPGMMWKHENYPNVRTENTRREGHKPPSKDTTQAMPTKRKRSCSDVYRGGAATQSEPELSSTGPDRVLPQSSAPLLLRPQEVTSVGLLPEPDFKTPATLSSGPAVVTQIQQRSLRQSGTPASIPKRRGRRCLLWEKLTGSMGGTG